MLGDEAWPAVGIPIHPQSAGQGWGQGPGKASQVLIKAFLYKKKWQNTYAERHIEAFSDLTPDNIICQCLTQPLLITAGNINLFYDVITQW